MLCSVDSELLSEMLMCIGVWFGLLVRWCSLFIVLVIMLKLGWL